ncbi:VTC domain-containing protein [Blakeslea trispora]|nr:VTC domain-containing protein [Blakeslea trispora]
MKFAQELSQSIFPPWRLSYVAYDILKQELKSRQLEHGWTSKDEEDFVDLLDNELCKVYDFVNAKLSEIDARILYCERTIQTLKRNPTANSQRNYKIMDEALTDILFDVNDLSKFTRINFTAIQKILKKHDRWTGLDLRQSYITKLREKPLDKQRFDIAIVYISALHNICRNQGEPSTADNTLDPNTFERATAKYWIHPDNVTEVKAIIMLHLPILVFNKEKKYATEDSAVSNVYFDNPDLDLYTERLQRDEMAEAIQFKWHGSCYTKDVFVERKTYHATSTNGASVKDIFCIKEDRVDAFISGKYTADQLVDELRAEGKANEDMLKHTHLISSGIQKSVQEKQLEPVLRAFYHRTEFQLPDSQQLCISLDTDLAFVREDHFDGLQRRENNHWRRTDVGIDHPFEYLHENEIERFPYAVLETHVQTHPGKDIPSWFTSLIESHLVHEVPHFSKYLHGASHFYSNRLALLPWWLSELKNDIRKPRAQNSGLTRSLSFKPLIDGRYHRVMVEQKEQVNIESVLRKEKVVGSGTLDLLDQSTTVPLSQPLRNTSEDFTLVDLGTHSSTTLSPSKTPLLRSPLSQSTAIDEKANTTDFSKRSKQDKEDMSEPVDLEKGEKKKKVKGRDPKTFFANERTFLSWLQFCALLLTVALNLLNFGDSVSRIVGGVFIGLAGGVAMYALYRFEKRSWMINRRSNGRYDDVWGPAVLCALLVGAIIVNFYLRFKN